MPRTTRRPSRAPHRRLPGHIDIKHDFDFCDEIAKLCFAGEIAYFDAIRLISRSVVSARPQKIATWVRNNLVMPAGKTNRHGRIVLTRMQSAIADLFQDPDVKRVTYIKGPRIGASFLIAALMLYFACHENRPVMFYDRAERTAQNFYEEKFGAIVAASVKIQHLLPDERSSATRQRWTNRTLTTGAGVRFRSVDGGIKSDMAAKIFADEAGDEKWRNGTEGSKVGLLKARAQEFSDSTVFVGGTPTMAGNCTVSEEWEKSNRCEWYMRFPCCGHEGEFVTSVKEVPADQRDEPQGPGIRFVANERGHCDGDVWYECAGCQRHIPETEKVTLLNTGWWQPTAVGEPGHVGVRSWSAHSQDPEATWTHLCNAYIQAREQPSKSQDFVNLWLGQVFRPPTQKAIDIADLRRKEIALVDGKLPRWIRALVCGGDGQRGTDDGSKPGRLEFVVLGVGEDMRFHPVERFVVDHRETVDTKTGEIVRSPIRPFSAAARQPVMDILDRSWETEDGRTLRIINTAFDVGYEMNQATEFVMSITTPTRPVVPVRGEDKPGRIAPIGKARDDRSFEFRNGVTVQKLGVTAIKDYIADTLSFPTPGPQSWTFPLDTSEEFYASLLAEELVETPSGRTKWDRKDKAETGEVWDCIVYAYAAFLMMLHWTGEWGTQVLMPQVRIRPQTVEASILAEAARVRKEEVEAEKASARPTIPSPPLVPDLVDVTLPKPPTRPSPDDMFSTIEDDDGPAFEIVRRPPVRPVAVEEPDENPFIIAGRRS